MKKNIFLLSFIFVSLLLLGYNRFVPWSFIETSLEETMDGVFDTDWTDFSKDMMVEDIEIQIGVEEAIEEEDSIDDVKNVEWDEDVVLPVAVNLEIPFFVQAPDGNRSLPWKEACEESSLILARHYLAGKELSKTDFKEDILGMVAIQEEIFGNYIDTSIEQTQQIYEAMYPSFGSTKILQDPTIEELKVELAQWHPIVAPFAGKELGNRYFSNGGPRYHMMVIRGYDDAHFYTNDVWTRRWENFPYTYDLIMWALHDLVPEWEWDINFGEKKVLVLMGD